MPDHMGVSISRERTCLASRGSRVRISPSPLAESNLMRTSREATDEFSARPFVKLNEVFSSLVERTYIRYVP